MDNATVASDSALEKRVLSREDIALFCQKRSEGATVRVLATHFGIPLSQAYQILLGKKYADLLPEGYQYAPFPKLSGGTKGRKPFTKEDVARMCKLHGNGHTLRQIAKRFDTTYQTIRNILIGVACKGLLPEGYVYRSAILASKRPQVQKPVKTKKPIKRPVLSNRFDEQITRIQKDFDRIVREAMT